MKKLILAIPLALVALLFSSCCLFNCGDKGLHTEQDVTAYRDEIRTVDPGVKGGMPYEVTERVAYTRTERGALDPVGQGFERRPTGDPSGACGSCLSYYCPKPDCCGIVSEAVLSRRTAQPASGEPHIGLIPTMKILAK